MLKRRLNSTMFLFAMMFLFISNVVVAQVTTPDTSNIDSIIKEVKRVNLPTIGYHVKVTQQIDNARSDKSLVDIPNVERMAIYTPKDGIKTGDASEGQSKSNVNAPKIMVNIGNYINSMEVYPNRSLGMEIIEEYSYYKLEGSTTNNEQRCIIYIDPHHLSVRKIDLYIQNMQFAVIDVKNTLFKSQYYLPEEITLYHATDGSSVILEFTEYEFIE
jgi:hypothetical protein